MGLLEITRERKTESILNCISQECPICQEIGKIVLHKTMLINIKNELKNNRNK